METQNKKVLRYMKKHGSITAREAMLSMEIYRLGARIWDLRHEGYEIVSAFETSKTGRRYKRYMLKEVENEQID